MTRPPTPRCHKRTKEAPPPPTRRRWRTRRPPRTPRPYVWRRTGHARPTGSAGGLTSANASGGPCGRTTRRTATGEDSRLMGRGWWLGSGMGLELREWVGMEGSGFGTEANGLKWVWNGGDLIEIEGNWLEWRGMGGIRGEWVGMSWNRWWWVGMEGNGLEWVWNRGEWVGLDFCFLFCCFFFYPCIYLWMWTLSCNDLSTCCS